MEMLKHFSQNKEVRLCLKRGTKVFKQQNFNLHTRNRSKSVIGYPHSLHTVLTHLPVSLTIAGFI